MIAAFHFGSWVDHLTDLKNLADRQEWKGQLSFKGIIRFDSNMEHDEVYGKFVLTVCICSILYF